MPALILFAAAAIVLAVLDAIMLTTFMAPLFRDKIGHLMLESPRAIPAIIFYAGYVAGLTFLVTRPALRDGSPAQAAIRGAVLGLTAYGTYEFTSLTILKDWSWTMSLADTLWGGILTGLTAWSAVAVARRMGYAGR